MFYSGVNVTETAVKFGNAVLSANGHNGSIVPTLIVDTNPPYATNCIKLANSTLGAAGNTAITYENNFASNAGTGDGIIFASKPTGASPQ